MVNMICETKYVKPVVTRGHIDSIASTKKLYRYTCFLKQMGKLNLMVYVSNFTALVMWFLSGKNYT
jgi:hypothetical protein